MTVGPCRGLALALALLSAACVASPGGEAPAQSPATPASPVNPDGAPEAAPDPSPPAPTDTTGRLLAWIDPDARGVLYLKTPDELDSEALATLFAVPSGAERILRQVDSADEGFEMLLGDDALARWFEPPVLAMWPVVAQGTYLVRLLKQPEEDLEAALREADMELREVEGLKLYIPRGVYPWKLVLLDDHAVGFIPIREIGSGVGPLTAARDLPPSEVETNLTTALRQDPDTFLELLVHGPLVHMALPEPLVSVRLSLRAWQTRGIDGVIALQPTGDPDAVVNALRAREGAFATDQLRALMDKVAFSIEGPIILGRLQIPAADRSALEREP
ncbi:MAG: hypothetical protein KC468_35775 [Myxococcales bacterium]|nr:hypothetical protein [Myxococcales bacterium]